MAPLLIARRDKLNMDETCEQRTENVQKHEKFYETGKVYWETVTPDVNGMLGGFGQVSSSDVDGSTKFLQRFLKRPLNSVQNQRVLDCGAGIGRVTKHLLMHNFDYVDMVEQCQAFINESYNYIDDLKNQIERRICSPLQTFMPENNRYDVIWCQWILAHIKDDDVVKFFQRCKKALRINGLLVVKDNVTSSDEVEMDERDCTLSRPLPLWRQLINKGGFEITRETKQTRFPRELYEVRMFGCELSNSS